VRSEEDIGGRLHRPGQDMAPAKNA
jgi:hypothetical protein